MEGNRNWSPPHWYIFGSIVWSPKAGYLHRSIKENNNKSRIWNLQRIESFIQWRANMYYWISFISCWGIFLENRVWIVKRLLGCFWERRTRMRPTRLMQLSARRKLCRMHFDQRWPVGQNIHHPGGRRLAFVCPGWYQFFSYFFLSFSFGPFYATQPSRIVGYKAVV